MQCLNCGALLADIDTCPECGSDNAIEEGVVVIKGVAVHVCVGLVTHSPYYEAEFDTETVRKFTKECLEIEIERRI